MNPRVSVVTVVFNDAKGIEKTINSVLSQNYDSIEYIIIDGGSKDGTQLVLKKYVDSIDVLVSEPDQGVYDAMNKAIGLANGEWIIFMNSGDCFFQNNAVQEMMDKMCECDVVYGDALYCYDNFNEVVHAKNAAYLKYEMPFNHQAVFVKTPLMKKYKFDLRYKYAADYNFFHSLYMNNANFLYKPIIVAEYHLVGGKTYSNIRECYNEVLSISGVKGFRFYKSKIRVGLFYYLNKYTPSLLNILHRFI